jgi:dTDP-4-dehydrorhamnose reductase
VRILLTGRNGQVGWELERALAPLGEVVATDRSALDLEYSDSIREAIRNLRPDVIVNAAAYTAVDKAESEPELAMQINGIAPGVLAEEAKRRGNLLVHFSTDYIFDGTKSSPYAEADAPNPLNVYGKTKLEGDRRIAASGCRHLILRTSWVYAPRGKNFFLTMAKKALQGDALRVVSDQHGAPTEAKFIAEVSCKSIARSAEGIFNVAASGQTTWHGFASAIVARLGARTSVEPIPSSAYPTPARRPAYSVLDLSKITRAIAAQPPDWTVLLDRCVKEWSPA